MFVNRGYEAMTSKMRVLKAINHEKPDRVPLNYMTNQMIDERLKAHLGLSSNDTEGLLCALGVDFRGMYPSYTGAPIHTTDRKDRRVNPEYGFVTRYIANKDGGYWDYCDFPLIEANEEEASRWRVPNPDDFNYNGLLDKAKSNGDFALHLGSPGMACIINTIGFLRGMEQVLIDLITDEPAGLILIEKLMNFQLGCLERQLAKVGKLVDFVWIGEDLGTQHSPLISKEMFHKHILPWHRKFIDMASSYSLPVMIHTCGASSWTYEDYIKAGIKGVETLQPEAAGMSPKYLKDTFGGRLFFHGCISTAGPLAYGTVDDVITNVRETLEIMMPGGGYILSPTHQIQDNSPVDNVMAMYNAAHEFGRY